MTWSPLGYLPEVEAVVANPRNARLLLAEGVYGVYRSTDGGDTWTTVVDLKVERSRIGYTDAPQWDLRDASVAYVPSTAGVLKSVDGGVTWRLMDNGIEPGNCCTGAGLAIDPFVAGRLGSRSMSALTFREMRARPGRGWRCRPPSGLHSL